MCPGRPFPSRSLTDRRDDVMMTSHVRYALTHSSPCSVLPHCIPSLQGCCKVGAITPILHVRRLRHREIK